MLCGNGKPETLVGRNQNEENATYIQLPQNLVSQVNVEIGWFIVEFNEHVNLFFSFKIIVDN